jgi:hypothetical protein
MSVDATRFPCFVPPTLHEYCAFLMSCDLWALLGTKLIRSNTHSSSSNNMRTVAVAVRLRNRYIEHLKRGYCYATGHAIKTIIFETRFYILPSIKLTLTNILRAVNVGVHFFSICSSSLLFCRHQRGQF